MPVSFIKSAALALLCAGSSVAWAQDAGVEAEPDEAGLEALLSERVVTVASRSAESTSEAPATTWIISGTDLKRFGIQSVEEAIRFLGHGMTSYEYDGRQSAAFGARGYLSDNLGLHLAVLIDGNQAGGSAQTARGTQTYMLPIELVDHIEVIIGPGSVLYGNQAMLGVINVITRAAASIDGAHLVIQGSAGLPSEKWAPDLSWGEAWVRAAAYGSQRYTLGGDPFDLSWHLGVRWDRQSGRIAWRRELTTSDPYPDPLAAYGQESVFNRDLRSRLFGKATWRRWSFTSWVALAGGTGTGPAETKAAGSYLEPEYGLDVSWSRTVSDRGDFSFRAYAVVFDSRAIFVPLKNDLPGCQKAIGQDVCSDTLHFIAFKPYIEPLFTWDWKADRSQVTTVGAQLFMDGSVIITGKISPDSRTLREDDPIVAPLPNAAIFAQHIWRAGFGTINAGVRADVGLLGYAISPRLAYSLNPWTNGTLKFIFATGFRTPTITERFLEIPNFLTSNPDIGPERVYSGEIDVGQKFGAQSLQLSVFGTWWKGLITTRNVTVEGAQISQFANIRNVGSVGANLGWQGTRGPFEWALSVNYAPGRQFLPADVANYSDKQLKDAQLQRAAVQNYGRSAFGIVLLPVDGMPDFYATGHLSWGFGEKGPRLSLAANLNSERLKGYWANDGVLLDARNVEGPVVPWSVDVRGAVEMQLTQRLGLRLVVNARTLTNAPISPRVGTGAAPVPKGGIGTSTVPETPLSAMAEMDVRL